MPRFLLPIRRFGYLNGVAVLDASTPDLQAQWAAALEEPTEAGRGDQVHLRPGAEPVAWVPASDLPESVAIALEVLGDDEDACQVLEVPPELEPVIAALPTKMDGRTAYPTGRLDDGFVRAVHIRVGRRECLWTGIASEGDRDDDHRFKTARMPIALLTGARTLDRESERRMLRR